MMAGMIRMIQMVVFLTLDCLFEGDLFLLYAVKFRVLTSSTFKSSLLYL